MRHVWLSCVLVGCGAFATTGTAGEESADAAADAGVLAPERDAEPAPGPDAALVEAGTPHLCDEAPADAVFCDGFDEGYGAWLFGGAPPGVVDLRVEDGAVRCTTGPFETDAGAFGYALLQRSPGSVTGDEGVELSFDLLVEHVGGMVAGFVVVAFGNDSLRVFTTPPFEEGGTTVGLVVQHYKGETAAEFLAMGTVQVGVHARRGVVARRKGNQISMTALGPDQSYDVRTFMASGAPNPALTVTLGLSAAVPATWDLRFDDVMLRKLPPQP